jgi:hypothetical protein
MILYQRCGTVGMNEYRYLPVEIPGGCFSLGILFLLSMFTGGEHLPRVFLPRISLLDYHGI